MTHDIVPSRAPERPTVQFDQAKLAAMLAKVDPPPIIVDASPFAQYAYAEFFEAEIENTHTGKAYKRNVDRFLNWCDERQIGFSEVDAMIIADYISNHLHKANGQPLADSSKKQHLAALKHFYDHQQIRHGVLFNPAAPVRGPKHVVKKGKTTPLKEDQVRELLDALDTSHEVGLRDRAILAVLWWASPRAGAVAKLRLKDLINDGKRWWLDFGEKGGKPHRVKVADSLRIYLQEYLTETGIEDHDKDWPIFRATTIRVKGQPYRKALMPYEPPEPDLEKKERGAMTGDQILRMVKRRVKDAGLPPDTFTPHSFRAGGATLLAQKGVDRERIQKHLGHADARTTELYIHSQDEQDEDVPDLITVTRASGNSSKEMT